MRLNMDKYALENKRDFRFLFLSEGCLDRNLKKKNKNGLQCSYKLESLADSKPLFVFKTFSKYFMD